MKSKKELLETLFRNEDPDDLKQLWEEMDLFNWKDEQKPQPTARHVIDILNRYLEGTLSAEQVEEWANFVEAADVILGGFDDENVKDSINDLANPVLEGALTAESAQKLIKQLQNLP